jgi:uncharacterized protein YlxW (UPF0749 family)
MTGSEKIISRLSAAALNETSEHYTVTRHDLATLLLELQQRHQKEQALQTRLSRLMHKYDQLKQEHEHNGKLA